MLCRLESICTIDVCTLAREPVFGLLTNDTLVKLSDLRSESINLFCPFKNRLLSTVFEALQAFCVYALIAKFALTSLKVHSGCVFYHKSGPHATRPARKYVIALFLRLV